MAARANSRTTYGHEHVHVKNLEQVVRRWRAQSLRGCNPYRIMID